REVGEPVVLADREDRHDARVREARDRFDLASESLARAGEVDVLGADELERDAPAEGALLGEEDEAHAAAAELAQQAELAEPLGEALLARRVARGEKARALERAKPLAQRRGVLGMRRDKPVG